MRPDVSAAEQRYRADSWQPRHAHVESTVSIVLAGSLLERVGRADEVARPFSIVVKPGGTEHADRFGPRGAHTLQIRLTPDAAARVGDADARLRRWRWMHGAPAVVPFLRLLRLVRGGEDGPLVEDAVSEVLAALAAGAPRTERAAPRWLRLVREELDATDAGAPRVGALARRADVHPVYLAREFRRFFGCSITEYVRRRRVRRAAALLADVRRPISSASYETGFADQSHLCRSFRRETGLSPLAYRRLLMAGALPGV